MASRKISELTALTAPASADVLPIVDVSEALPENQNKKITYAELLSSAPAGTAAAPSFAFDGDPDSGVYSAGANQLAISTGGTERLRITSAGLVGIGTSSPSQVLNVVGNIALGATPAGGVNGSAYQILGNSGTSGNASGGNLTVSAGNGSGAATNGSLILSAGETLSPGSATTGGSVFITSGKPSDSLAGGTIDFRYYSGNPSTLATAMRIDSSGRVGIGTTSPNVALTINSGAVSTGPVVPAGDIAFPSAYVNGFFRAVGGYNQGAGTGGIIQLGGKSYTDSNYVGAFLISAVSGSNATDALTFSTQTSFNNVVSEKMRLDNSGRLLVGTSSSVGYGGLLQVVGGDTARPQIHRNVNDEYPAVLYISKARGTGVQSVLSGDEIGAISFVGNDGTQQLGAASIRCFVDGTPGANDMPGRLVFSTTADGASSTTEQLRIDSAGTTMIGGGAAENNGSITIYKNNSNGGSQAVWNRASTTAGTTALNFKNGGTQVGTVVYNNSSTAYNTSSDYRLKENVTPVTDGITRLQQLKPSRFNFIADPDTVVDGFIAHEVQSVVPEAITGEKDAVDDNGNPQYQGIDQSKLVPLLTAALQEAIAKIETLEARLTAAGL